MISVSGGKISIERFAESPRRAHCFFEWIYFANVASTMDDRSVYLARKSLGEELARLEDMPIDENTIVVPVPDTSKCAADAMAYQLGVPSAEGLIRNRYTGRTFIEGTGTRANKAASKYTPLREVLEGKRVLLVEDSIVRSTTMRVLISRMRKVGRAKEIHVRVACPPIIAPCFYGIDMSTISELFAPRFMQRGPAAGGNIRRDGPRAWAPIRSAICRSNRSPARSIGRPTSCAGRASPAAIRRRTARSSTRSRWPMRKLESESTNGKRQQSRTYEAPIGAELSWRADSPRRRDHVYRTPWNCGSKNAGSSESTCSRPSRVSSIRPASRSIVQSSSCS